MASPSDPSSQSPRPSKLSDCPQPSTTYENPFVAFRRFTDSQISSFLKSVIGVPSVSSQLESSQQWDSVDDWIPRRKEALTHARHGVFKGFSNNSDEYVSRHDLGRERREEEMRQWGAVPDESSPETGSKDMQHPEAAEIKKQERLGWDGKQRHGTATSDDYQPSKIRHEKFTVPAQHGDVGMKQVVDYTDRGLGFLTAKKESNLSTWFARKTDPFTEPAQAVSWLLTDVYSPLYLDQSLPHQLYPSWWRCEEDSSFNKNYQSTDMYPLFAAESIQRHDPRLASKVDWRLAFQDLINVQCMGNLPWLPLEYSEFDNPNTLMPSSWIAYLIGCDSLGPHWNVESNPSETSDLHQFRFGKSSILQTFRPYDDEVYVRDGETISILPCFGRYEMKNDALPLLRSLAEVTDNLGDLPHQPDLANFEDPQRPRPNIRAQVLAMTKEEVRAMPGQLASTLPALPTLLAGDINRNILREINGIISEIDKVGSSSGLREDGPRHSAGEEEPTQSQNQDEQRDRKPSSEPSPSQFPDVEISPSHNSSSLPSLSYPYTHDSTPPTDNHNNNTNNNNENDKKSVDPADSIIATLTTLETQILPDGRTEIRRVMKKRFADGREETNESLETRFGDRLHEQPRHRQGKKPGWFWN